MTDADAFAKTAERVLQPERDTSSIWLMPSAPNYATVGQFYGYLRSSLEQLCASLGEARLFCGDPQYQLRGAELNANDLIVVNDLKSARSAIDFIVEQGEGSPGANVSSHFRKFSRIKEQCVQLTEMRPAFRGHRLVARNPVMRPPTAQDRVHVNRGGTAVVLDAANAIYAGDCAVDSVV